MKRLVLIRHAKSSWANPLQSDFDRKLNERGEHDAPMMGHRIMAAGIVPGHILSSTARRAADTAKLIAQEIGFDAEKIEWCDDLYHCVPAVFEELIQAMNDDLNTLIIIAHNPGISEFAASLDSSGQIHHMPTCAVAGFELDTEHWSELLNCAKKTFLFDTPKNYHD
ncbi:MAG: histidine phosphatase family protein [Bacteroidetes bacterium]|nr:histidine phosphatase family protein [Bacteroidota bacterium]MBS1629302.1 histidine phosphatase family protein [Bacteroidota bacterium]